MHLTGKENLLRAIRHHSPDHVPYAGDGAWRMLDHAGGRPPLVGADEWGVIWAPLPAEYRAGPDEPAQSYPAGHPARSAAELLAHPDCFAFPASNQEAHAAPPSCGHPFPHPSDTPLGLPDGTDAEQPLIIGRHGLGMLDRFEALLGMDAAMQALLAEREASQAVLERIAAYHIGIARRFLAAGAEAGWLADDYAGQGGPLISPTLWRQLILPGLTRVIEVYRAAGLPVFFHTCGRAEPFVPELLDAGATVLNLQGDLCDLPALKARYGRRIAFFGGVASDVMLTGSPAEVRLAARAAMLALGREGGLILAPDQPLAFPASNQAALEETARADGVYPL